MARKHVENAWKMRKIKFREVISKRQRTESGQEKLNFQMDILVAVSGHVSGHAW
jgi:hypothetical protein